MVKLDKETREAIAEAVKAAQKDVAEIYNEVYVSGAELGKHISMFSGNWLEQFGWKLPRERIEVMDGDVKRVTRWGYPLHRIQRMIAEGVFKV